MNDQVKIAVVEDEDACADQLTAYIEQFGREKRLQVPVARFRDGDEIAEHYRGGFDIILMDIQMEFMDGMTAAMKIRESDRDVVIMFITNAPQYAIEGYQVQAVDYILKPISWFAFSESLSRALAGKRSRQREYITIALRNGRTKLDVDRICYVEVLDHRLIYNTLDGTYTTKGTISDAEAQLNPARFFRCNRCYLVNLK